MSITKESVRFHSHPAAPVERRRVAIAGGGTAGHVNLAVAIADAFQRAVDNVDLLFIGTAEGFENRLVPQRGYRLETVPGSPILGEGLGGMVRALWCLLIGMVQARHLLRTNGTRLVIGLGGYASAGVLLAAWSLGLRTVIHEANIVPGLANKLLGRLVSRVYLGFQAASRAFPKSRILVTGNPVRPEIARLGKEKHEPPHCADRPVHILVTGGSQGSPFLNRKVPGLLRTAAHHSLTFEVMHQVGNFDPEPVGAEYAHGGISASITAYIDDMANAYRWTDFVITSAGSGTIAELAACGLPALLVPLAGSADDHQAANAVAFAETGGGWWVHEEEWQPKKLAARIAFLLGDPNAWRAASERSRQLAIPDAACKLVADCEAMMEGQW